jgi:hypothetical protein
LCSKAEWKDPSKRAECLEQMCLAMANTPSPCCIGLSAKPENPPDWWTPPDAPLITLPNGQQAYITQPWCAPYHCPCGGSGGGGGGGTPLCCDIVVKKTVYGKKVTSTWVVGGNVIICVYQWCIVWEMGLSSPHPCKGSRFEVPQGKVVLIADEFLCSNPNPPLCPPVWYGQLYPAKRMTC